MDNITLKKLNELENAYSKFTRATEVSKNENLMDTRRLWAGLLTYAALCTIVAKNSSGADIFLWIAMGTITGLFPLLSFLGSEFYRNLIYPAFVKHRESKFKKVEKEIFQSKNGMSTILHGIDNGIFSDHEFIRYLKNEIGFRIDVAKKFKKDFKEHYYEEDQGISEIAKQQMRITEV